MDAPKAMEIKSMKLSWLQTWEPLKVEDVSKFDQMHYYGTEAVDEATGLLGISFIEDFFLKPGVILTEEEIITFKQDLYMSDLPEKDAYISQLKTAGFTDIKFDDLTEPWLSFVSQRPLEFCQNKERHVRVIGQDAFDSLEYFYSKIKIVFEKGLVGGCRVIATKPAI
ncbi:hypothetical protein OS493_015421 [Desmophyllum pertusum]|uniref:Uncharacterized protein n=1 Tax=Desmophyllum pertusum TaxID=174260 RepID=A0A9X0CR44_9CNID|nr:hypothetical protein OS493_015421 [Desmophyllum pertusum]